MKKLFSNVWKRSIQPRKQRKYKHNAPLHIRGKFMSVNLSKELRKKHGTRNFRVRTGDKVKVLRGQFKGREGKVEGVDLKKTRLFIAKLEISKRDGSKARVPVAASNVQITELDLSDKKRVLRLQKRNSINVNVEKEK